MARAVDHQAAELGIVLDSPSALYWRNENDHSSEFKVLERLRLDGSIDLDSEHSYAGDLALSKEDFRSLFKLLANAMEPISAGATRLRLARQVVKRTDLRCELIDEMPQWFQKAIHPSHRDPTNIFASFLKQFDAHRFTRSVGIFFEMPEHETDQSIIDFVKTCHAHDLINESDAVQAISSEFKTISQCMVELVGVQPVLSWRSDDGQNALHLAIKDLKPADIIDRLLEMGVDPRDQCDRFTNVLERAAFMRSERMGHLLQSTDWSPKEISGAIDRLHGSTNQQQETRALLQASLVRATLLEMSKGAHHEPTKP